jgi:hypothetical protein
MFVLAIAWSPSSSSAAGRFSEKRNFRISKRDARTQPSESGSAFARTSRVTVTAPFVPFASITVDRFDDTFAASACTAAANDCSLRGAVAFANSNPGTTINVPAGTYNLTIPGVGEGFNGDDSIGDLDITATNTTIIGAGAASTIIHQTTAVDRVIEVNPFLDPGFVTSISNVTISGGSETTGVGGGGIISGAIGNTLTLTNCIISGNSATGAGTLGGGGVSHAGGNLSISGCSFTGNSTSSSGGGLGYSAGDPVGRTPSPGTLTISGSTFSGNTASSAAAGGGAADLFDFNQSTSVYQIDSSSFANNTATNGSGGAIIVESGQLTTTTSSFSGNHAGVSGGAVLSAGTLASVRYSRLVGNTVTVPTNGNTLVRSQGIFAADDDWWGVNTGPGANDFRSTSGPLFPTTFLKLQATASPNTICTGGTSTISADIKQRNAGPDLTVELNGLPSFPATIVNATPALGNLSGVSANFVNGSASATFTAGATAGTANIDVTADNQTVTASIVVQTNTTTDPADQAVCQGGTATFTTTASGPGPITFVWKKGATVLSNGDLGGRVTIVSGASNSTLTISNVQSGDADTYTVEATGSCSTATQSATLTVNTTTTATTPSDQAVCQGASASFSTTASGTGPFHYAWTVDGSSFDGDNSSISVPTGSLTVGNHPVSVTVTGACNSVTKNASLTVQASTTTSDPADQTVCQGASASFSTTANGTGPFHYAWTVDGSPFNGDNPSISVPTGSLSVGNHTVAVTTTGTCGSASQNATLTVQQNTATSDPADQTVCQGATAGFSTTATGTAPFHYSWTLDGSPFNGDNPSISVPTGSLSIGNHTVAVTTSGTCGSASQTATLTVQQNTATSDPPDQTVCQGAAAGFSTTASGTGPFHYAWTLDGSPFNGDSPSISVPTGSLSIGNHTVAVTTTGTCGSASQTATLTVQETTATSDPADQTVCQGATAGFSTTASGTGPFHYSWTLDGSPFNGDNPSISVPTGSLSVGNHTVAVTTTGTCGSASQTATLTVQENTTTSDPPDQTVCKGASAGFSTTAGGTGPFHYSWTVDGSPFNGDSPSISVPTGSLSVGNHTVSVTTSGACGSASQSATLTVEANTTTSDPSDQTVCQGATAAFSTTAGGTGPFHYAWTLDGSPFNGDSASINVPTGSLSVGNHTVAVTTTGSCGTASQSATLTVEATTSTTDPADQQACLGGTASFSTTASGTGPFTFVWKQGATGLTNASLGGRVTITNTRTTSTLTISNVQSSDFGTYTVDTSGTCGTASQSATLTVNSSPPTITLNNSVIELWPPNHSYHTINLTDFVTGASSCDGTVNINSVIIDHVTSDEVENGNGSGNTLNDIVIACNRKSVQLRAEREGGGDGRVYTIYFKATDSLGHSTTVAARVMVPTNQNGTAAIDSGPHYTVTNPTCP